MKAITKCCDEVIEIALRTAAEKFQQWQIDIPFKMSDVWQKSKT